MVELDWIVPGCSRWDGLLTLVILLMILSGSGKAMEVSSQVRFVVDRDIKTQNFFLRLFVVCFTRKVSSSVADVKHVCLVVSSGDHQCFEVTSL